MKPLFVPSALLLLMTGVPLAGATAPHDLEVKLTAVNVRKGQIAFPGPARFTVTVTHKSGPPVSMDAGYKIQVAKYDHTGQRFLKTVYTRELPLLSASGMRTFTTPVFDDTASTRIVNGMQPEAGATFIYRALIGPGYYTDPNNANNRSDVGVRFIRQTAGAAAPASLTWRRCLTAEDFTRVGATLTPQQIAKLNGDEYSLQSIISSGTDRLVDAQRCANCHTGTPTQPVMKYRPELGQLPITKLMNHRPTRDSDIVGGYNWQNRSNGAIGKFIANGSKPDALRKIFQQWLNDGAR